MGDFEWVTDLGYQQLTELAERCGGTFRGRGLSWSKAFTTSSWPCGGEAKPGCKPEQGLLLRQKALSNVVRKKARKACICFSPTTESYGVDRPKQVSGWWFGAAFRKGSGGSGLGIPSGLFVGGSFWHVFQRMTKPLQILTGAILDWSLRVSRNVLHFCALWSISQFGHSLVHII